MSSVRLLVSRLPVDDQVQVLEIAEQGARMNFNRFGKVSPVAILLARKDFDTGDIYEDGPHVIMLEPKEFITVSDKDDFAWIVKDIATKSNARDLAFVSECWSTMLDKTGGKAKIEAVIITTESVYSEPEMWIAEISRLPSGEGRLKNFVKQEEFSLTTGRFTELLPTRKFVS